MSHHSHLNHGRLEGLCGEVSADQIRFRTWTSGVDLLRAQFRTERYAPHRHDTYAIGVTDWGVQTFQYRGEPYRSLPGQIAVLHPDEIHDGYPSTDSGFGYHLLYIDPSFVHKAVRSTSGDGATLPFQENPVFTDPNLAATIQSVFTDEPSEFAVAELIGSISESLIERDQTLVSRNPVSRFDVNAIERAKSFLDTTLERVVRIEELEVISGLDRYELARQFRKVQGTSPYRYSVMRRLTYARSMLQKDSPLVEVALSAGFADQPHFTRMFTRAFGITPARFHAMSTTRE